MYCIVQYSKSYNNFNNPCVKLSTFLSTLTSETVKVTGFKYVIVLEPPRNHNNHSAEVKLFEFNFFFLVSEEEKIGRDTNNRILPQKNILLSSFPKTNMAINPHSV